MKTNYLLKRITCLKTWTHSLILTSHRLKRFLKGCSKALVLRNSFCLTLNWLLPWTERFFFFKSLVILSQCSQYLNKCMSFSAVLQSCSPSHCFNKSSSWLISCQVTGFIFISFKFGGFFLCLLNKYSIVLPWKYSQNLISTISQFTNLCHKLSY